MVFKRWLENIFKIVLLKKKLKKELSALEWYFCIGQKAVYSGQTYLKAGRMTDRRIETVAAVLKLLNSISAAELRVFQNSFLARNA